MKTTHAAQIANDDQTVARSAPTFQSARTTCASGRWRRFAVGLVPLALAVLAAGCAPHQTGSNQCPEINQYLTAIKDAEFGSMPASVDAAVAAYLASDGAPPGCAVGIMQNNAVAYLKGYGSADLANDIPFTHTHAAVVGSVSKTWTALAVLRLLELHYLELDDPISDYLQTPAAWNGITIRQLLSHTSGLQRDPTFHPSINTETELSQFLFPFIQPPVSHLGVHPGYVFYSYLDTPVVGFEPGATAGYSNTGYLILGALLDTIVKDNAGAIGVNFASYESFVWRQVGFFDASLSNRRQMLTPCLDEYWRQTDIPDFVRGYSYDGANYVETGFSNSPTLQLGPAGWAGPAGGWTMTIGDLVRLMAAIQNNDIISAATRDQEMMQSHGQTVDGNGNVNGDWGLGVALAQKLGRPVYLHDGAYPGHRARYTVWPDENFGVAIMANESEADTRGIIDAIAALFIGNSPGAAGAAAGPAGGVQAQGRSVAIDDNDPGIGGVTGRSGPLPQLTDRERRITYATKVRIDRQQLSIQKRRTRTEAALNRSGFVLTSERLLAQHGISLADEFARFVDTARSPGECIRQIAQFLNRLTRDGVIDSDERGKLLRGASLLVQARRAGDE